MANKASSKAAKKAQKKSAQPGSKFYGIVATAGAVGAAKLTKKALDSSWRAVTGRKPPKNPADPTVAAWEAVTWAAASGAGVALARLFAERKIATYQAKSALPPAAPTSATTPVTGGSRKAQRRR